MFFGYDRYLVPQIEAYRTELAAFGEVVEPVDVAHLHYLTSAETVCTAMQHEIELGYEVLGILSCGTGMGMSIAANKFSGIYAARCATVADAEQCRTINNANVLCLAANQPFELNRAIIAAFIRTEYVGRKLDELEYITRFERSRTIALRAVP